MKKLQYSEELFEPNISKKLKEMKYKQSLVYNMKSDLLKLKCNPNIVVDIGGGNGSNLYLLKKFGIQFKKGFVVDIKRHESNRYFENIVINLDEELLPFGDNSVDLILLIEVIEHLKETDHILKEIKRVLSCNGIAVITTPNLSWYPNILLLSLGYQPLFTEISSEKVFGRAGTEVVGHLRIFTYRSLRQILKYYNFKILKYKSVQTGIVLNNTWLRCFDKFISTLIPVLGSDNYAIIKK